jgi:adenylosuccinate synthase
MLFVKEKGELLELGFHDLDIMVDPRAIITTPWDIIANQARERAAGDKRLGSCGVGIRDTVERNEMHGFGLTLGEMRSLSTSDLVKRFETIRDDWLPEQLDAYKTPFGEADRALAHDGGVFSRYLFDLDALTRNSALVHSSNLKGTGRGRILFEGSQGLGLDQTNGTVPHVTRSNTGLKNVIEICEDAGITDLEVYYVTRSYLTRHGAGPMENEGPKPFKKIVETTNDTNEFQGAFRYGMLDAETLRTRIQTDLKYTRASSVNVFPKLAVTCVDQVDDLGHFKGDGITIGVLKCGFPDAVCRAVGLPKVLISEGPTRATLSERFVL